MELPQALRAVPIALAMASPVAAQCADAKIVPSVGDFGAQMGTAIALSGNYAIIGAPYDNGFGPLTGAVHLFERDASGWSHAVKLSASDVEDRDRLGFSVDIDGELAITGSRYDEEAGYATGAAYIYTRLAGVWTETAKLLASDMSGESFFGQSVAIQGDRAVVGTHGEDSAAVNAGAAYVFDKVGGVWTETAKLVASDAADSDQFGWSLALDGDTIMIGARGRDDFGPASGAVYVFDLVGGIWTETAKLLASDGASPARFGVSVSLDGDQALVGASFDPAGGQDTGAAYLFDRTAGVWNETSKFVANDAMPGDFYGASVSIAGDHIAIGAFGADDIASNGGATYVYENGVFGWSLLSKVRPPALTANDNLGFAVAINDNSLLMPARGDDTLTLDAGALYTYSPRDRHDLEADVAQVSLSSGGTQTFTLSTCPVRPGAAFFLLGTTSGTAPGFDSGDFHMPLNVDFYLLLSLQAPNFYPLPVSQGILDAAGEGTGAFRLNAGENPGLAGLTLHHAFGVIDSTGTLLREASNPVAVQLVP